MAKAEIFRTFTWKLLTTVRENIFREISPKSFCEGFLLIFSIFQHLSENSPRISQKIIAYKFYHFPEFHSLGQISENRTSVGILE